MNPNIVNFCKFPTSLEKPVVSERAPETHVRCPLRSSARVERLLRTHLLRSVIKTETVDLCDREMNARIGAGWSLLQMVDIEESQKMKLHSEHVLDLDRSLTIV